MDYIYSLNESYKPVYSISLTYATPYKGSNLLNMNYVYVTGYPKISSTFKAEPMEVIKSSLSQPTFNFNLNINFS